MKIGSWSLAFAIGLFLMGTGHAQEQTVTPDRGKISDGKTWRLVNAEAQLGQEAGKQFVRLQAKGGDPGKVETAGLALVEGLTFREGTIEVHLKGRNVRQHRFLGVTFHATDGTTFETVYFRPFNFKADPPLSQPSRAVHLAAGAPLAEAAREFAGRLRARREPGPGPGRLVPCPD